jgi:hypothetical protein
LGSRRYGEERVSLTLQLKDWQGRGGKQIINKKGIKEYNK